MPQSFRPKINADHPGHFDGSASFWGTLLAAISIFAATLLLVMALQETPLDQGWVFVLIGLAVLLPYAAWLTVLLRYDRWMRRPWKLTALAAAWGSLISFAMAIVLETLFDAIADSWGMPDLDTMTIAPFWEEAAKGIFIVLLYAFGRRHLQGPWDGLVYGALTGAGFGFAEDVGYLASSLSQGGFTDLVATYTVREVFTAHLHPMFTAATGLAAGMAARRQLPPGRALRWILWGALIAFILHAIFDSATVLVPYAAAFFFGPVYGVIMIIALRQLRRHEDVVLQGKA